MMGCGTIIFLYKKLSLFFLAMSTVIMGNFVKTGEDSNEISLQPSCYYAKMFKKG